jgi:hypothetical protein
MRGQNESWLGFSKSGLRESKERSVVGQALNDSSHLEAEERFVTPSCV